MTHTSSDVPVCDICGNTDALTIYKYNGVCYCDNYDCQVANAEESYHNYRAGIYYPTEFFFNDKRFEEDIKKMEALIESRRKK